MYANQVYLVSTGNGPRYVRADSVQAARLRAFKVWGSGRSVVDTIGQWAPDNLGRYGYQTAVNSLDVMPSKAAHQDNAKPLGSFYRPVLTIGQRQQDNAQRMAELLQAMHGN